MAAKIAPAVLAAARAFQSAQDARTETLYLGRTSVTVRHDDRYRAYVTLALLGGATLGGAATLLLAPRSGAETRARVGARADRWWPQLDRIPRALRAARNAATGAFHDAFFDTTATRTV